MNKSKLSSWTLAIAVILILGGLINISRPDFEPDLWEAISGFCLGLVFAVITWRLRVGVRREQEAAARAAMEKKKAEEEARRLQRDQEEARRKPAGMVIRATSRVVTGRSFAVAGVTFDNDDGSSRQEILREICEGDEDGDTEAWLEWYQLRGKDAYRVMTSHGCVGNVRKNDIMDAVTAIGASKVDLAVEQFEREDGTLIYRADLIV